MNMLSPSYYDGVDPSDLGCGPATARTISIELGLLWGYGCLRELAKKSNPGVVACIDPSMIQQVQPVREGEQIGVSWSHGSGDPFARVGSGWARKADKHCPYHDLYGMYLGMPRVAFERTDELHSCLDMIQTNAQYKCREGNSVQRVSSIFFFFFLCYIRLEAERTSTTHVCAVPIIPSFIFFHTTRSPRTRSSPVPPRRIIRYSIGIKTATRVQGGIGDRTDQEKATCMRNEDDGY